MVVVGRAAESGKADISTFATAERGNMQVYIFFRWACPAIGGVGGTEGGEVEGNKDREPG